jgi:hypothetical protein
VNFRRALFVVALATLAACASEPTVAPAPAAPAVAAAPVTAAGSTAAVAPTLTEAQIAARKWGRSQGYTPKAPGDGNTLWCKSEAQVGSRLAPKPTCVTEAGLADLQKLAESNKEDMLRHSSMCSGSACGAN